MTDVIELLRAHDPERDGGQAPPIGPLLARLGEDPEPARPGRPRRPSRVAVAVTLACLAAVAIVAVAVGGSGGDDRRDGTAVHDVPAAGSVIVHTIARTRVFQPDGRPVRQVMGSVDGRSIGTMDGPVERWSATAPNRWRQIQRFLPSGRMPGGTDERAYADRVERMRMPWQPGVTVRRAGSGDGLGAGVGPGAPASRVLLAGTTDPRAAVRRMLDSGEAEADGEVTRGGRRLLRLVATTAARRPKPRAYIPATRTVYLIDAETHAPVEVERFSGRPWRPGTRPRGAPDLAGPVFRTTYESYEQLPLNDETAPLLRFGGPTR
ncbi:hypothetical protein [Conexibacter sp. CPCC 206217]|uniref:hypothetical protein n=1 Tax=Conexibacter sp. CPCC 206217 TaxID=3064574 RepID=UPI002726A4C8|nr:hypothetical protein [Conexibacter sp. CPCC 206217]MDO8212726.1 hypothetical protein [Conexibacter sp. CPCC 206217]